MSKPILLLVEDSEDDAFIFKRAFAKSGVDFSVCDARNGAEAIEMLQNASAGESLPRIVFLDLKMPIVNGFEVLSWMRQQAFSPAVPVVVVSGSAQKEDKDRAFALGARDYLVKPVSVPDFQRLLAEVCDTTPSPPLRQNGGRS